MGEQLEEESPGYGLDVEVVLDGVPQAAGARQQLGRRQSSFGVGGGEEELSVGIQLREQFEEGVHIVLEVAGADLRHVSRGVAQLVRAGDRGGVQAEQPHVLEVLVRGLSGAGDDRAQGVLAGDGVRRLHTIVHVIQPADPVLGTGQNLLAYGLEARGQGVELQGEAPEGLKPRVDDKVRAEVVLVVAQPRGQQLEPAQLGQPLVQLLGHVVELGVARVPEAQDSEPLAGQRVRRKILAEQKPNNIRAIKSSQVSISSADLHVFFILSGSSP